MNLKLKTMKKQYLTFGLVALFGCSLLFVSCNKDENAQLSNSSAITVAEDDVNSDNLFDDVYSEPILRFFDYYGQLRAALTRALSECDR